MNQPEQAWRLVDLFQPEPLRKPANSVTVDSEETLARLLRSAATELAHEVMLVSPSGSKLFIAIGGPLAAVNYYPDDSSTMGLAGVAEEIAVDSPIYFTSDGQPLEVQPDRLLPVDTVIQAALYFFRTQDLPRFIKWEEE